MAMTLLCPSCGKKDAWATDIAIHSPAIEPRCSTCKVKLVWRYVSEPKPATVRRLTVVGGKEFRRK